MSRKLIHFTDVDDFDVCERRYWAHRFGGLPKPPSPILAIGDAYHKAIDFVYMNEGCEFIEAAMDSVAQIDRDVVQRFEIDCLALAEEVEANLERMFKALERGPGLLTPPYPIRNKKGWLLLEHEWTDRRLGYRGKVDAVMDSAPVTDEKGNVVGFDYVPCVFDWKTVHGERRRSQRDATYSPQLALYSLAMGVKRACFVEIPRNLEKPIRVRSVTYSDSDLAHWADWFVDMRAAILSRGTKARRFKRTDRKNPLCSPEWCWLYPKCYPAEGVPCA